MNKIIYLKYGELTLKGKNRKFFQSLLIKNLKKAIIDFKVKIIDKFDHLIIEIENSEEINELITIITKIPGFAHLSIGYVIDKDIEVIKKTANQIIVDNFEKTFKIESKRSDKSFYLDSIQIKNIVAGFILENNEIKVDVKNPDIKINIEIKKNYAVVFSQKIECTNGLPINSSGRCLLLLSGGIDSPVAAHLLMKRGLAVDFLTFITPPHTSEEALNKVIDLANIISLDRKLMNYNLHICDFSKIQHEMNHVENKSYNIALMRRSFFRIAEKLKEKYHYDLIATGEAIGQVASQTIESLFSSSSVIENSLIIRPLITYNKNEIITLAKKINTYETSILPYDDSCSLFAPKHPITKPKIEVVKELEDSLSFLTDLEEKAIEDIKVR